ncbi:Uncharacterised protein [Candidatus Burarchaeum australiense]|nr:Uncharacterised protein [Candidatus Burarchaeum australiense]
MFSEFKTTYAFILSAAHSITMSVEEKKGAIDAWSKHVAGTAQKHKFASFSSVAEEAFCETFKRGILADKNLTKEEKREILESMKSQPVINASAAY